MLHRENDLIKLFKYAIEQIPQNNYILILNSMAYPKHAHRGIYNEPTSSREVAVIIEGGNGNFREISLVSRQPGMPNNNISTIAKRTVSLTDRQTRDLRNQVQSSNSTTIVETHRLYDRTFVC